MEEVNILHNVIIILSAILLSAFFSGMEIAFLSCNKLKLELDRKESGVFDRISRLFASHPSEYMTTLLIGNNVALVVFSITMSQLLSYYFVSWGWMSSSIFMETLISTVIIIFTAEFIPKTIVKNNPNFYYKTFAVPVYLFYLCFYPIAKITNYLSMLFMRLFGIKMRKRVAVDNFNKHDLANLVEDISSDNGVAGEQDQEMKIFQNALDFSDIYVRDCMLRRVEIEAIDVESSVEEARSRFIETKFSRLPVFEGSIDHIIGYINIKELFKCPTSIRQMLLDIVFVPESMSAQKLLGVLIKDKCSIAIVLDEYGGTAGLVSLEDILEEIFGEIEDEHDESHLVEKVVAGGGYLFSGRLEVEDLNEKYALSIELSDEYETLAGFIIYHNEGLPKQGDEFDIKGWKYKIIKTSASKVELIKVTKI